MLGLRAKLLPKAKNLCIHLEKKSHGCSCSLNYGPQAHMKPCPGGNTFQQACHTKQKKIDACDW